MTIIDAYTHILPLDFLDEAKRLATPAIARYAEWQKILVGRFPYAADISKRIEVMDKYKIDYQVLMPVPSLDPNMLDGEGKEKKMKMVRMVNDKMAEVPRKSGGRLFPIGAIPLAEDEADEAKDEMDRAVNDLGLKGFMVPTNHNYKGIDTYTYIWEHSAKIGVPVFIHPSSTPESRDRPYENELDLMHVFGWPFETTLMLSRLVLTGIMERNPGLKVVGHHLGAMIPIFLGRIKESYPRREDGHTKPGVARDLGKEVYEYFKMLYYDTAVGGSVETIRLGCDVFGPDHLVFATDFPYGPSGGQNRLETYPALIRSLRLSKDDEDKILEGNARKLLKV